MKFGLISLFLATKKIDDPKFYLTYPQIFFERKDTGFVRFRSILDEQKKSEQKILNLKKVRSILDHEKKMHFFSGSAHPGHGPFKWVLGRNLDPQPADLSGWPT